jgi:drug/metabolite transporter (DMT)-like permease
MALAGGIMCTWTDTLLESFQTVQTDMFYLVPLSVVYSLAFFLGLFGFTYLDASVASPLENIDGALAVLIIYFYYLLTGSIHPSYTISVLDVIATVSIIIGVILVGRQEQTLFRQELHLSEDQRKHRYGALALFFPIIYTLFDVFSVAEIEVIGEGDNAVSSTAETVASIPAIDFFVFECMGFAVVSLGVWLYMAIVKKYAYNPFQPEEIIRCGAATGETFGTMTFILAAAINPVLTAPVTTLYCLVTMILARVFLKECLTKKQYISLSYVLLGIILLGVSEIIRV